MPNPVWPLQSDRKAMNAAFGNPDANGDGAPDPAWVQRWLTTIVPPYQFYYAGKRVKQITLNKTIAAPVMRALTKVLALYPDARERAALGIDQFDGCFNFRAKRGSSSLSMHAFAVALDFNAARNPFRGSRSDMPEGFIKAFTDEGATWGGTFSKASFDPMHFQFARVK